MALPAEMKPPPSLWVPVRGKIHVLLPYTHGRPSFGINWLRDALGPGIRVNRGERGTGALILGRNHTDLLRAALVAGFPGRSITIIRDVSFQTICAPACQQANPKSALLCECSCGGINHGGTAGWTLRGQYAIDTQYKRVVMHVTS